GGFAGFRAIAVPKRASDSEILALRMAFFAGAQHLFASSMAVMDSDREPTAFDLHRMSLIHQELEAFGKDFELRHSPVAGGACPPPTCGPAAIRSTSSAARAGNHGSPVCLDGIIAPSGGSSTASRRSPKAISWRSGRRWPMQISRRDTALS